MKDLVSDSFIPSRAQSQDPVAANLAIDRITAAPTKKPPKMAAFIVGVPTGIRTPGLDFLVFIVC
jgi:hypothetical protein